MVDVPDVSGDGTATPCTYTVTESVVPGFYTPDRTFSAVAPGGTVSFVNLRTVGTVAADAPDPQPEYPVGGFTNAPPSPGSPGTPSDTFGFGGGPGTGATPQGAYNPATPPAGDPAAGDPGSANPDGAAPAAPGTGAGAGAAGAQTGSAGNATATGTANPDLELPGLANTGANATQRLLTMAAFGLIGIGAYTHGLRRKV